MRWVALITVLLAMSVAGAGPSEAAAGVTAAAPPTAARAAVAKPATLPPTLADLPLIVVPAEATMSGAAGRGAAGAGGGNVAGTADPGRGGAGVADVGVGGRGVVGSGAADNDQWFGVFLSGDGGWARLDKRVSRELAKHGIPIVGWDSLKYFWSRRTPDGAAHDLDRVLEFYSHAWGRTHVLLIGFSQGADTMPFMFNRLPAATHDLVGFTTLLGISDNALWEFHVATWLGHPAKGVATAPELEQWRGSPYLCMYGESDADAACAQLTGHDGTVLKMAGGHHFGGRYTKIADEILTRLPRIEPLPSAARDGASSAESDAAASNAAHNSADAAGVEGTAENGRGDAYLGGILGNKTSWRRIRTRSW